MVHHIEIRWVEYGYCEDKVNGVYVIERGAGGPMVLPSVRPAVASGAVHAIVAPERLVDLGLRRRYNKRQTIRCKQNMQRLIYIHEPPRALTCAATSTARSEAARASAACWFARTKISSADVGFLGRFAFLPSGAAAAAAAAAAMADEDDEDEARLVGWPRFRFDSSSISVAAAAFEAASAGCTVLEATVPTASSSSLSLLVIVRSLL